MKTTAMIQTQYATRSPVPYPNAASHRQLLHRTLDFLLLIASSVGIFALLLFLLVLL